MNYGSGEHATGHTLAVMGERVGIYSRISEDPLDLEMGVTRQVKDARAFAAERGWTVGGEFVDNDLSALKGGPRPAYERLLKAIQGGEIDRVVAVHSSRMWRNRRERAEGFEVLATAKVPLSLVKGMEFDMTTASGRVVAGVIGEFDTMESELKAERVRDAARHRAEAGKANGAVAYGWRRVKHRNRSGEVVEWHDEVDADQAAIVNEIVDRLLAHESLNSITADLNARKVPTPRGGDATWRTSSVRKLALRLANIGRVARGRADFGPAEWPPIVDRDRHDRVAALLNDPARVVTKGGARQHLLTFGIGRCGKPGCGGRLRVQQRWLNRRRPELGKAPLYVCDGPKGCVGRREEWVDDLVERVVVRRLQQPDARDLLTRDDTAASEARKQVETLRAKLADAADAFAADEIDRDQLRRINAKLRPQLEKAEQESMRAVQGIPAHLVAEMIGPAAQEKWRALKVTQKRALLEAMGVTVTIMPARGGAGFKPESVNIAFATDDDQAEQPDTADLATT